MGFPIFIHNDMKIGHTIRDTTNVPTVSLPDVDTIIVGGGLSGLAAAHSLGSRPFQLYELSDRIGGTSASQQHQHLHFSQGAHYDLEYPENYGEDTLQFLENLGIIEFQPWNRMWSFRDQQHIIPHNRQQRCYENGIARGDVIPDGPIGRKFIDLMTTFSDQMVMPTRLIDTEHHHLNELTFWDYLIKQIPGIESIKPYLDYHMKDDWGAGTHVVSALAGIHYFACRPYYREPVNVFSPPQGNAYFAYKIRAQISDSSIVTGSVVRKIESNNMGHQVEIYQPSNNQLIVQNARNIIYAGQKHALKYISPGQEQLFDNEQAPWMVVNLICDQKKGDYGFWQNEVVDENESFLGFVDSSVQHQSALNGKRILSGYYCLSPESRPYLADIDQHKEQIISDVLTKIQEALNRKLSPEAAYINVMGHAMPIPKPGYLLKDANHSLDAQMIYAGVDNGRLPLLFEAIDSGILASKRVI
jgi:protoporphyrinogen oxidase